MSNVTVVSRTQRVIVDVASSSVSVINAGPQGPAGAGGPGGGAVTSVNTQTGAVVLDADDISDTSTANKFVTDAQRTKIDGFSAVSVAGTTDTLTTGDADKVKYYTNASLVTVTIPNTLPVKSKGFLTPFGAAGLTTNVSSWGTVSGAESCGQEQGLYWEVLASDVLMLRGGDVVAGGGDMLAANNLSDVANAAISLANLNGEVSGTAATEVSAHDAETNVHGIADTSVLLDTSDIGSTVQPAVSSRVTSVSYSASIPPNCDTTDVLNIAALTGAITLDAPTGTPHDGQNLRIRFEQDGTGGRVVTYNAAYAFGSDVTSALDPSAASESWERLFTWHAGDSKWRATAIVRGF